ncbi:general secretion pathway protein GspK [Pseudidiomarina sp. CB1]|uniref:general secretion pathway protein GspK n=1 Tax=Pseudidiomarina sp. CB1 TaxID=2972484 RepID=UPI0021613A11|nr:general secretion pathway protein GspK [Pseudidiomarina sp. CB1]
MYSKQEGMALFQVLLIVAIISVLLLIMSNTTKSQVERALVLQQQTEKQLALHSAANYVDLMLLANDWGDMRDTGAPLANLNFHSYPSRLSLPGRDAYAALPDGVAVSLQNVGSLINLNQANQQLRDLLVHVGVSQVTADMLLDELQRWLYRPDRIYLQHVNELRNIRGWTPDIIERIRPYVTAKIMPFNGAWAPDALLPILLTSGQADTITALRQSGQYQAGIYEEFSGQETGFGVSLYPSKYQRVTVIDPLTGEQLRRGVRYATHEKNPRTIEYKRYLREQRIELNEANPIGLK